MTHRDEVLPSCTFCKLRKVWLIFRFVGIKTEEAIIIYPFVFQIRIIKFVSVVSIAAQPERAGMHSLGVSDSPNSFVHHIRNNKTTQHKGNEKKKKKKEEKLKKYNDEASAATTDSGRSNY